uniref:Cytochrome P450 n=1 Tax=Kalanchoe fedtschenkoi TaxID=63787 RepID=A0A7N0UBQ9_KALFE
MASQPPKTTITIHHSLHSSITLAPYLTVPILITAFLFLALLILKQKLHCRCEICHAYTTMSWSKEFANLCDWYTHLLRKSPTRTLHVHALGNIITADPKNVEHILKTRFDNYPKGKPFSSILGDLLGKGIFNVDGDVWMFQKKMASHELGRVSLRSYCFEVVSHEIDERLSPLVSSMAAGGGVLDLQKVFRRFSFDTICRFSFGMDPTCLESSHSMNEFAASFDLATRLSAERAMHTSPLVWKTKRLLNIGSEKRLHDAIKVIDSMAQEIIVQKHKLGLLGQQDLLSHFMLVVQDDTYLRDIVVSFILAGRDSVASALSSFFFLLASHPEVEDAIAKEADSVVGKDQNHLKTFDQIKDLPYLQATVYESMRLFPPIQFDSKFCLHDDVLPDGTQVTKGARVTYHPYAMGRMEEIWGEDSLEFRPERWLRDGLFHQESPFKYPVFQAGPRVCLGKEMALVEIKTVAFWFIRHYSVKLAASDGSPVPKFSPGLTATFRDGLQVLVTPKKRAS